MTETVQLAAIAAIAPITEGTPGNVNLSAGAPIPD